MSDPDRVCGSCTACCTVLGVPELEKPTYQTCTHLCPTGCGIYADRPGSCRTFACEWLRGVLEVDGRVDPDLRPDVCGVVFDYRPESPVGEVFTAWEVQPGASARAPAADLVRALAERHLVVIVSRGRDGREAPGGRRYVGPPHLVGQASDAMWSRPSRPGGGGRA